MDLPWGVIKKEVRSGTGEKASVRLVFTGNFTWAMDEVIELRIAADVLRNMLRESLREEMSGTYGVHVTSSVQRYPQQRYFLTVTFNCSPENVEQLTEEVFARIMEIKEGKDLDEYIDPIVKKRLSALEIKLKENSYWLDLLTNLYRNDIKPDEYFSAKDLLENISLEGVASSAREYFDFGNYINVVYYHGT